MANMIGSFDGISFQRLTGYRVSACYNPGGGGGFGGNFFVTIHDRTQAGTAFDQGVDLGPKGKARRGTLEFKDAYRTYSFKDIDLIAVECGATRNQRYRLLKCSYDAKFGTQSLDVTLSNSSEEKLADNPLEKTYDVSVTGKSPTEHLLGYRTGLAVAGANIQRFITLRAGENSMLAKLIEIGKQEAEQKKFPEFTIEFSQGSVVVNQKTVSRIYVHESYGSFHNLPLPSFARVREAQKNVNLVPNLLDVAFEDFTTRALIEFNDSEDLENFRDATTQVATVVMQQGQQAMTIT